MSDKIELKQADLEKVSGGYWAATPDDLIWYHQILDIVMIKKPNAEEGGAECFCSPYVGGNITAIGWYNYGPECGGAIYVECSQDTSLSGWYPDTIYWNENKNMYELSDRLGCSVTRIEL